MVRSGSGDSGVDGGEEWLSSFTNRTLRVHLRDFEAEGQENSIADNCWLPEMHAVGFPSRSPYRRRAGTDGVRIAERKHQMLFRSKPAGRRDLSSDESEPLHAGAQHVVEGGAASEVSLSN